MRVAPRSRPVLESAFILAMALEPLVALLRADDGSRAGEHREDDASPHQERQRAARRADRGAPSHAIHYGYDARWAARIQALSAGSGTSCRACTSSASARASGAPVTSRRQRRSQARERLPSRGTVLAGMGVRLWEAIWLSRSASCPP